MLSNPKVITAATNFGNYKNLLAAKSDPQVYKSHC